MHMASKKKETLAQILQSLLEREGISVLEIAEKAQMSEKNVGRIFKDQGKSPSLHTLASLLKVLNASAQEKERALTASGYPPKNTLGGAIVRLILERQIQLKVILAKQKISGRSLTRILKNEVRPYKHTIDMLLDSIDATLGEKMTVLRIGKYRNPQNQTFGKLHRALRLERKIVLEKLARSVGITTRNLWLWERGFVRHPKPQKLEASIQYMQLSLQETEELRAAAGYHKNKRRL